MATYVILAIQLLAVLLGLGVLYISVISKREEQQERLRKDQSSTHSHFVDCKSRPGR